MSVEQAALRYRIEPDKLIDEINKVIAETENKAEVKA